jgi:N-acetylneuraminic acid mutarotase
MRKSLVFLVVLLLTASTMLSVNASSAVENTWVSKANMPQAVNGCKAVVYDGRIFVIGNSANYMYDPTTDVWTVKTPMPTPRMYFAIAVFQDAIYVIGGRGSESAYSLNEVYFPSNDSWVTKKSMPVAASDIAANVFGQKIYVIWGSENLVYDILNDSWTNATSMPHPVSAYASAIFQNNIYFFGGSLGRPIYCNYTQIYNPTIDTWTLGAPIPTKSQDEQENIAISAVSTSGSLSLRRIYVLGGWSVEDVLSGSNLNRVYNPENDSWTFGAPMPTGRVGVALAVVNDAIYAIGGNAIYISSTSANEQYFPFGYGTPDPIPTATPSPTPSVPEFASLTIPLLLTIMLITAGLLVYHKKHKHNSEKEA